MFRAQIGQISRVELPLALISHRERWLTRDDRRGCSVPFSRSQSQSTPLSRSSFLGVPTKVSFSSFLSLIRLRLLSDPKHTNSTYSEGRGEQAHLKRYYSIKVCAHVRSEHTRNNSANARKERQHGDCGSLQKKKKEKKTRSFQRKIDKFRRYRDAPWCLDLLKNKNKITSSTCCCHQLG